MGNINPAFWNRIKYTIKTKQEQPLVIPDPIGWESDEKEFSRNGQYHGIVAKFSNSLRFNGIAADHINFILELYGINEAVELIREERHPITDKWTLTYKGFLDLSTWESKDGEVSVKFNSGGLEQLLKSREGEKVEVDRINTIDGNQIPELGVVQVGLDSRNIFLKTKFEVKATRNSVVLYNQTNGQTRGSTTSVPLRLISKSHENAHEPIEKTLVGDDTWERTAPGETGNMFFAVSDKTRVLEIDAVLKFKVNFTQFDDINFFRFWVRLATYKGGVDYILKTNKMIFTSDKKTILDGKTFSFVIKETITLLAGESLALQFDQNFDGKNGKSAHLETTITNIEAALNLNENSFSEPSNTKCVLVHDLASRLITIATNEEDALKSNLFGRMDIGYTQDGTAAFTGFSHGFWIRGFDRLPIPTTVPFVQNLFKPLTTSFKDFITSMEAVWNVGIGIETFGSKERVVIEELGYFYNKNTTIKLPNQVKNVKRSMATDLYYSGIEVGFEKGGDYEEAMGLDEYNGKTTFITIISRIKNVYSKLSKYRADSYGLEFARRKSINLNNTQDSPFDLDVFMMDLKRSFDGFKLRKWEDDFEKEPTGVFSPETAFNLRFSPVNCMLRHGWRIASGLQKYMVNYLEYGSSSGNSNLKTKLIGRNEYSENERIINSELANPRFLPVEIEFEHVCDFEIMQMVEGNSVILGKEIRNFYGLVEFINENNEMEKGFLMNLKPNGKGAWKVLKFNR